MSQQRWSGRFAQAMDPEAVIYGASIGFDQKLARYDIQGSLAYAQALQRAGLLTTQELKRIKQGLQEVLAQVEAGKLKWRTEWEDIHMHVEKALTQKIGALGGKLHTGRSRNDQVATDVRLYCMDHLQQLIEAVRTFQAVLVERAEHWLGVMVPGYTHLQRAQPVLLSHHMMAYVEMLARDEERLQVALKHTSVLPLGSGALAGNPFPIDRVQLAKDLGFSDISHNSLDAVSDRDFAVEITAAAALLMVHLSRLSEELIMWSSTEFGFLKLPESYCTGSSMMPQKINPDIPELVRGKTGRVVGHLVGLLTLLKGQPLAYNKDMQEDKEALFDTFETLLPSVAVLGAMMSQLEVHEARMNDAASDPAMLATDLADWLVRMGLPFREAHEVSARAVRYSVEENISLAAIPLPQLKKFHGIITEDIYEALRPEQSMAHRAAVGGSARKNVLKEIRRHQKRLK